jgi:hypothetical protein
VTADPREPAVAARVVDGGCRPEAWSLRLAPSSLVELLAVSVLAAASMGNLVVGTFMGSGFFDMLGAFAVLGATWVGVIAMTETALADLTGGVVADVEAEGGCGRRQGEKEGQEAGSHGPRVPGGRGGRAHDREQRCSAPGVGA